MLFRSPTARDALLPDSSPHDRALSTFPKTLRTLSVVSRRHCAFCVFSFSQPRPGVNFPLTSRTAEVTSIAKPAKRFAETTDAYIVTLRLVATTDPYPVTLPLTSTPASPLQCAHTKNEPASPLESALTKSLDLKLLRMNIYETRTGVNFFFY